VSDIDRVSWEELQRRADTLRKSGYDKAADAMQRLAAEKRWPDYAMSLYWGKQE
jgi:hypothetical protein